MNFHDPVAGQARSRSASDAKNCRVLLTALALLCLSDVTHAQTLLPPQADSLPCTFAWSSTDINPTWFPSDPGHNIPVGDVVLPANSLHFSSNSNCEFYKWSAQMFLWLTSPPPPHHGPNSHVFDSPLFFDVSPPDPTTGQRTLQQIKSGVLRTFGVNITQKGPQGKPVVFDKTGKMFIVVRPQLGSRGRPVISNKAGQPIEIGRTQLAPNGKPVFLDRAGKVIDVQTARNGNPRLLDSSGKAITLQNSTVTINGKAYFIDTGNNVVDFEQGEADGNVLMAQNGSLVYYALEVNDVYASFLTGQKTGRIAATKFPTTQADLNGIQTFAANTFPDDANVLAVEVKSAWIETSNLVNPADYITITATIPNYTIIDSGHWARNGSRTAQLALVGMHIVGSALGHPEMIWATFEHVNNTPNAAYTYNDKLTGLTSVPQSSSGTWLFSATPAAPTSEPSRMRLNGANIDAVSSSTTISAANILRLHPWGTSALDFDGNPNPNFTANNSDIIATNNSVRFHILSPGDVRQNYILTGTTWGPAFSDPPDPADPLSQLGTNRMANTTMETFVQGSNCFDCHNGTNYMLGILTQPHHQPPTPVGLSHIYGPLRPQIAK